MRTFFQIVKFILEFNLATILRNIALPFVFVYVTYFYLIDLLSETNFNIPQLELPKPVISPLFVINEKLQNETVKNLRKVRKFPRNYKKQDIIDALLITN